MNAYLKLVNFEVNRFAKLYGWIAIVIFTIQIVTTIIVAKMYMHQITDRLQSGTDQAETMETMGLFTIRHVIMTIGFIVPIAIGIASLLFYMFFIWYRDWFAKSAFIYRLLTLPTARMNVFLAKITTIMLSVLGLVAMQLLVLQICHYMIRWMVPVSFRGGTTITEAVHTSMYLNILYPGGFIEFLIAYGIGFSFVVVVFTVILLERSFRIKGLFIGIVYGFGCFIVSCLPVLFQWGFHDYLYDVEFFFAELAMFVIITLVSMMFSRYLLNHKVTI